MNSEDKIDQVLTSNFLKYLLRITVVVLGFLSAKSIYTNYTDSIPSFKVGDCIEHKFKKNEFTTLKVSGYLKVLQIGKTQYLTERYDRMFNLRDNENTEDIRFLNRNPEMYRKISCDEIQGQDENQ